MEINSIDKRQIYNTIEKNPIGTRRKGASQSDRAYDYIPRNTITDKPLNLLKKDVASKRRRLLHPISERNEYNSRLKRILSFQKYDNNEKKCIPYINLTGYEDIDEELKGAVSYCGAYDISNEINMWLTARTDNTTQILSDEEMADIVNVLDYSLNKIDKKYGKYEGIVYRKGFFNPITDKQYYSSSISPTCTSYLSSKTKIPSEKDMYSIIKVKNGHNLYDFQRDVGSIYSNGYADSEQEILIDRNSNFRIVDSDNKLKEKYLAQIILKKEDVTEEEIKEIKLKYSGCLKYISVWEEI